MRRFARLFAVAGAFALMSVLVAVPAVARPATVPGLPVYLALGDSWAYGEGSTDPATGGYVPQLRTALQEDLDCLPAQSANAADGCKQLQLVNLGRPGTDTMPGVTASIVAAEQLPVAIPMLEARNHDANPGNDVEVITLHVGGNDVSGPIQSACLLGTPEECITTFITEMATYEADLRNVVGQLRAAAGDDTPIVLGTYDNPVPFCFLGAIPEASALGATVLEGAGPLDGVHDVIRRVAADYGAEVADVFGQFEQADFVGGEDCLHPSDRGHDEVTEAFRAAIND